MQAFLPILSRTVPGIGRLKPLAGMQKTINLRRKVGREILRTSDAALPLVSFTLITIQIHRSLGRLLIVSGQSSAVASIK